MIEHSPTSDPRHRGEGREHGSIAVALHSRIPALAGIKECVQPPGIPGVVNICD
jgi:hypothetical protein